MTSCKGKIFFLLIFRESFKKISPSTNAALCQQLTLEASGSVFQRVPLLSHHPTRRLWEMLPIPQPRSLFLSPTHCLVNALLNRFHRPHSKCSPRRRYSRRSPLEAAGEGWWMKTLMRGGGNFWRGTEPLPHAADRRGRSG